MAAFTETQLYSAWQLLEGVGRSRAGNMAQSQAAVEPAMQILVANLDELGFTIADGNLVPKPPPEEPPAEEPPVEGAAPEEAEVAHHSKKSEHHEKPEHQEKSKLFRSRT